MKIQISPNFSLGNCHFAITKTKEFSARIAMWRQFNLDRAYTMEATYCGFDSGCNSGKQVYFFIYKINYFFNFQITIDDLMEMGASLCEAIMLVKNGLSSFTNISTSETSKK